MCLCWGWKLPPVPETRKGKGAAPREGNRPPTLLRAGELLVQPDERLSLPLVRRAHEHPFRVRLLPVDLKARQLRRQRHAALPQGKRGDGPAGWDVREGMRAAPRSTQRPGGPPEDAD